MLLIWLGLNQKNVGTTLLSRCKKTLDLGFIQNCTPNGKKKTMYAKEK
jgi:hypothetical protein